MPPKKKPKKRIAPPAARMQPSAGPPPPAARMQAPRMRVGRNQQPRISTARFANIQLNAAFAAGMLAVPVPIPPNIFTPSPPPPDNTLQPLPTPGEVKPTIIDDEVALQIFRELGVPPDDHFLNSGKVLAWALQPDDPAFINIHDYVARGQLHGFGIKILSILRIIPKANSLEEGTSAPALDFNDDPAATGQLRMMLWHGTRRQNLRAILENGLKLPASHGQMFGSGIYFADRVSKSCQYCDNAYLSGGDAYLFLCDVLLGNMYKAYQAMATLTGPPVIMEDGVTYTSVKGCGVNVPDFQWDQFIDGCIWPLGMTTRNPDISREGRVATLNFNEYIVYDTNRVQPKYLVKVEFTRKPVHEQLY